MNRFSCTIVASNKGHNVPDQCLDAVKVIRSQQFALQDTEPNFDLIQPRRILGQPIDLDRERPSMLLRLVLQPRPQPFRGVSRAIIQNQDHSMNATLYRRWHNDFGDEGLKIDEAFMRATLAVDLSISYTQSGEQLDSTAASITWRDLHWLAGAGRAWSLLPLSSLNRGLFIQANQPTTLRHQFLRPSVKLQYRSRPDQKGRRIQNVLPGMIPPRLDLFGRQPTPHRASRDAADLPQRNQLPSKLRITPTRQRLTSGLWAAASQSRRVRSRLGGKNGAGRPAVAGQLHYVVPSTSTASSVPSGPCNPSLGQSVGCSTPGEHELLTRYERVTPALEASCGHSPDGVVAALLHLLMQSYTWVSGHACRTSIPKYTSILSLLKLGTYLRNAVLRERILPHIQRKL